LYEVGSFAGDRFTEWNGKYRDDVRSFVKSDPGKVQQLAARIMGSPDIYPQPDREPHCSINFITCHDGFTINDLVSYNGKHNEANGEKNRDGCNYNVSWNCGEEGLTDNPVIEALRLQQIKNFLTILFVSQGTPMILMGDEVRRTQHGNNNAYCQDNELSWFDWSDIGKQADILRFMKGIIRFTQERHMFRINTILQAEGEHLPYITWHGLRLDKPNWGESSRYLAFSLRHPDTGEYLHIMLSSYWEPLTFELPNLPSGQYWHRIVDTGLAAPHDLYDVKVAPAVKALRYRVNPRSSVVLMAK
jgi:glycogen operon protein